MRRQSDRLLERRLANLAGINGVSSCRMMVNGSRKCENDSTAVSCRILVLWNHHTITLGLRKTGAVSVPCAPVPEIVLPACAVPPQDDVLGNMFIASPSCNFETIVVKRSMISSRRVQFRRSSKRKMHEHHCPLKKVYCFEVKWPNHLVNIPSRNFLGAAILVGA